MPGTFSRRKTLRDPLAGFRPPPVTLGHRAHHHPRREPLAPLPRARSLRPRHRSGPPSDDAHLRETLKRCSPATLEAVRAFRTSGNFTLLPTIVTGVIERFVERELRAKLAAPGPDLRLIEDLGLDSLTLMEIVILTEDVFP